MASSRLIIISFNDIGADTSNATKRIIQRGMSLKGWVVSNAGRAWRGKLFPMRDEPESERAEEGAMLLVNEYHYAEHRATDVGPNTGVCGGQSNHRFFRAKAGSCV